MQNNRKNKILKTTILMIMTILIIIGILQLTVNVILALSEESETLEIGELAVGEINPSEYTYNIPSNAKDLVCLDFYDSDNLTPKIESIDEVYCIEPGQGHVTPGLRTRIGGGYFTKAMYDSLNGTSTSSLCQILYGHAKIGFKEVAQHSWYNIVTGETDYYNEVEIIEPTEHTKVAVPRLRTPPYYSYVRTEILSPAMAYIVSSEPKGQWSAEKQYAIWSLRGQEIENGATGGTEFADLGIVKGDGVVEIPSESKGSVADLVEEATRYAAYHYKVEGDNGLAPKDTSGDVYPQIDQATGQYTLGPFSMEYTDIGSCFEGEGKSFSGITDMYVIGYNSSGAVVNSNIGIQSIILEDQAIGGYPNAGGSLQFFEPSQDDYKVDTKKQVYPKSGQNFYIVINNPNAGGADLENSVAYVSVKVKFKYMLAYGQAAILEGKQYTITYDINHEYNEHSQSPDVHIEKVGVDEDGNPIYDYVDKYGCEVTAKGTEWNQQYVMAPDAIRCLYEQELDLLAPIPGEMELYESTLNLSMNLGGNVWEDGLSTKETKANGLRDYGEDSPDSPIANVKVTLYTIDANNNLTLAGFIDNTGMSQDSVYSHINPTYTDANGNYLFKGIDPMRKYVVAFEYNGQTYMPTDYLKGINYENEQYANIQEMYNLGQYGGEAWQRNSKATEHTAERNAYDARFAEIASYPDNYRTNNSLNLIPNMVYNSTYTKLDLMGYKLTTSGEYKQTGLQLIDGYRYNVNGVEEKTDEYGRSTYTEGIITKQIKAFILQNLRYPNMQELYNIYYFNIANGNIEILKKIQFIEDCKMTAYTKPQEGAYDRYALVDQFLVNVTKESYTFSKLEELFNGLKREITVKLYKTTYDGIFPNEYYVNLGLWRRQTTDAQLKKDLYKVAVTINGQTQAYRYNSNSSDRTSQGRNPEDYWEIAVRVSDYANYYSPIHERPLYSADANANTGISTNSNNQSDNTLSEDKQIEVYATYKIAIKNTAGTLVRIDEVVDYYDEDYVFMPNMSWLMYEDTGVGIVEKEDKDEYIAIIDGKNISAANSSKFISINDNTKSTSNTTQYTPATQFTLIDGTERYQNLYINLKGDNHKLRTGETEYLFLTFKVNRANGKLILDQKQGDGAKNNLAEINGYSTFYVGNSNENVTNLPNYGSKGSGDIAGIIDIDSTPGNFNDFTRENGIYEHRFEDDTDRAQGVKIYETDELRQISGTVWEDKRTYAPEGTNALVGNGLREAGEAPMEGIEVSLWEIVYDGNHNVIGTTYPLRFVNGSWMQGPSITHTDSNGAYSFTGFIPGDYIVMYKYNGQDYKSTSYQRDLSTGNYILQQDETTGERLQTDVSTNTIKAPHYYGYTNPEDDKQNTTAGYGYSINRADEFKDSNGNKLNVSDAKDIWSVRNTLNESYKDKVVNKDTQNQIAGNLRDGTVYPMIAETGVIRAEVEYNRERSEGKNNEDSNYGTQTGNSTNGNYHIADLDFGLEERPKAGLELDKKVSNVKITLSDKTVLFDAMKTADDLIWQPKSEYNVNAMKSDREIKDDRGQLVKDDIGPVATNPERVYSDYRKYEQFRNAVWAKVNSIVNGQKGLIQATMDEEIMHGATIEITYDLKVTNIGEEDYNNRTFYYIGSINDSAKNTIVTTKADVVLDYVSNNLQFKAEYNDGSWGWEQITGQFAKDNYLATTLGDQNDSDKVDVNNVISQYNAIITTTALNAPLVPIGSENNTGGARGNSATETKLLLRQTISPQNTADEFVYGNIAEIVSISNDVGRRMAYSIQGNQNPMSDKIQEPDTSRAENVVILPPFGTHYVYIGLSILVIAIIAVAIIVIKKFTLKNKNA